jgi:hypothetical protein
MDLFHFQSGVQCQVTSNFVLKVHTIYTMDFKNILALMHNIVHMSVGSVYKGEVSRFIFVSVRV